MDPGTLLKAIIMGHTWSLLPQIPINDLTKEIKKRKTPTRLRNVIEQLKSYNKQEWGKYFTLAFNYLEVEDITTTKRRTLSKEVV